MRPGLDEEGPSPPTRPRRRRGHPSLRGPPDPARSGLRRASPCRSTAEGRASGAGLVDGRLRRWSPDGAAWSIDLGQGRGLIRVCRAPSRILRVLGERGEDRLRSAPRRRHPGRSATSSARIAVASTSGTTELEGRHRERDLVSVIRVHRRLAAAKASANWGERPRVNLLDRRLQVSSRNTSRYGHRCRPDADGGNGRRLRGRHGRHQEGASIGERWRCRTGRSSRRGDRGQDERDDQDRVPNRRDVLLCRLTRAGGAGIGRRRSLPRGTVEVVSGQGGPLGVQQCRPPRVTDAINGSAAIDVHALGQASRLRRRRGPSSMRPSRTWRARPRSSVDRATAF